MGTAVSFRNCLLESPQKHFNQLSSVSKKSSLSEHSRTNICQLGLSGSFDVIIIPLPFHSLRPPESFDTNTHICRVPIAITITNMLFVGGCLYFCQDNPQLWPSFVWVCVCHHRKLCDANNIKKLHVLQRFAKICFSWKFLFVLFGESFPSAIKNQSALLDCLANGVLFWRFSVKLFPKL